MPDFSPVITDYWTAAFSGKTLHRNEHLTITVKPDLDHDERAAILRSADDKPASVTVSPAVADALIKDIAALGNPTAADTEDTTRFVILCPIIDNIAAVEPAPVASGMPEAIFIFDDGVFTPFDAGKQMGLACEVIRMHQDV